MLAMIGAPDVLLAYQPNGSQNSPAAMPDEKYPKTQFSCLVDNSITARELSERAVSCMG